MVLPLLLFIVAAWLSRNEELRESTARVSDAAAILREHADRVIETEELILEETDRALSGLSWDELANSEAVHRTLAAIAAGHPQVQSIWLVSPAGMNVASSFAFPMAPIDASDRDYFGALRQSDRSTFISAAYRGRVTGRPIFNFARRRSSSDGSFDGIVIVSIERSYFSRFWATLVPDLEHYTRLVRADGTILATEPEIAARVAPTALPPGAPFYQAIKAGSHGAYPLTSSFDNRARIVAYDKLEGYDLYLVVGTEMSSALLPWWRDLERYGAFAFVAAFCLSLLCWLTLKRSRNEHDVIAQLEDEMSLREKAEAALRETQKMEALGRLTGGIAHDFNNLLAVIAGNLDSMEAASGHPQLLERLRRSMSRAVDRGERLTRQLLAFARQQRLNPTIVDLSEHLRNFGDMIERALGSNISAKIEVAPELWPVLVDPHELDLSLLNIAFNARDAMPEGGDLTVAASNVAAGSPDLAAFGLDGDFVSIAVADTGAGISPEILDHVFDPFFTTKAQGKGTGLGLSQVYGFVQQLGGRVRIDSVPGRGTTVALYFPRMRAVASTEPPMTTHNANPLVLVVEDDSAVAEIAEELLAQLGFRTKIASSGREALELLRRPDGADIVFSDVQMPGMSGIQLAQEARRLRPGIPILLTSGYTDHVSVAGTMGLKILSKPYRIADLRQALADLLADSNLADAAGD